MERKRETRGRKDSHFPVDGPDCRWNAKRPGIAESVLSPLSWSLVPPLPLSRSLSRASRGGSLDPRRAYFLPHPLPFLLPPSRRQLPTALSMPVIVLARFVRICLLTSISHLLGRKSLAIPANPAMGVSTQPRSPKRRDFATSVLSPCHPVKKKKKRNLKPPSRSLVSPPPPGRVEEA